MPPSRPKRRRLPNVSATRVSPNQGVTHLLFNDEDYTASDFSKNASDWAIHIVAKSASSRLYQID